MHFSETRGGAPVHRLLEGALFNALLVSAAAILVDQDDAVFRPFVDRLSGTGREATRIGAVIANTLEIEEEGLMFRQAAARHLPRFIPRKSGLVDTLDQCAHRCGRIFVNVHETPLLVGRDIPNGRLADLSTRVENGHSFEHAIGAWCLRPTRTFHTWPPGLTCSMSWVILTS